MVVLLGIIFFHILVILRGKTGNDENVPYLSVLLITVCLVAYVVLMLSRMESPQL